MIEECVIVGGGVAGLSTANRLVDIGISPLIIEGGDYPAHKTCGEFFSYECLPIVEEWAIPMASQISTSRFFKRDKGFEFQLPISSRSCSRFQFDIALLNRALQKKARILKNTQVISLTPPKNNADNFVLTLSDGLQILAKNLVMGTGRLIKGADSKPPLPLQYVGFKAHFEGIKIKDAVEIHIFKGGYLGISNIDSTTTNVACLVKKEFVKDDGIHFMKKLENDLAMPIYCKHMAQARMIFPHWMEGQLPEFGIRDNPSWDRVFWIGDAAGSIPPVCGEGLAIAVTSGCMAADYLASSNSVQFKAAWLKRYRKRFMLGQQIHQAVLSSWMSTFSMLMCRTIPGLPRMLWTLTRE